MYATGKTEKLQERLSAFKAWVKSINVSVKLDSLKRNSLLGNRVMFLHLSKPGPTL